MKLKRNKNLSLPCSPQGRRRVETTKISCQENLPYVKLTRFHFVALLYQFFYPADSAIVTGYITTVISTSTRFHLRESKSR